MTSHGVCLSLSDSLHLVWSSLRPSMLSQRHPTQCLPRLPSFNLLWLPFSFLPPLLHFALLDLFNVLKSHPCFEKQTPPLQPGPHASSSCHPASLPSLGAIQLQRVARVSQFSSFLSPAGLGSPNSLQQAALTVAASVLYAAKHVDIVQISLLPETPISIGLFHAVVSCLSSHFSGHLPFVPYLALSVNVPQRSFLLCSSSSIILPSVTTSIHVFKVSICSAALAARFHTNIEIVRDITLSTKVHLVKAMVFPVVMYGCESWTVKKAERWRIDAFELWC